MNTPAKPSRPRDAASLVIHRHYRQRHEVLMGRRGSRARFKPGVYVFPGGVLERADFHARPGNGLQTDIPPQMAVANSARRANALAMAAVRETFEEAGLLYGTPGAIGGTRHPTWQQFGERGVTPDLAALDYLGRAITPSFRPLRFHARFFALPYDALSGELRGDGELEDLRWVPLAARDHIDMMAVQSLILDTLQARLSGHHAPARRLLFKSSRRSTNDA